MLTSIALDIAVVLILVFTAIAGYKKGFLKYVISIVGTLLVLVGAYSATGIFAPVIYDNYLQPKVLEYVSDKIGEINIADVVSDEIQKSGFDLEISNDQLNKLLQSDGDISKSITNVAEENGITSDKSKQLKKSLDDFFENNFLINLSNVFEKTDASQINRNLDYNKNYAFDTVRAMAKGDNSLAAQYLEQNIIKGMVMSWVKILLFIVLFIVFSLILKIILKASCIFDHIPVANGVNKFLGFVIGLTKGLIIIAVLALICRMLINSSGDSLENLNMKMIDKSYIFKHIYEFIGD